MIEEVVVGKTVADRTETVRDTVRRQDVDVQNIQGQSGQVASATSAATMDTDYHAFYDKTHAKTGNKYDYYSPVFRYGQNLTTSDQNRGKDWKTIEQDARTTWETRNPGTWDEFKDGIRHAWEQATNKR